MATYVELQQQIANLQAEAERAKREEVPGVIARIKEAIAHYGLTAADLGFGKANAPASPKKAARRSGKTAAGKVAKARAKYGDGAGQVWGGRGPRPRWLREAIASGRSLQDFLL